MFFLLNRADFFLPAAIIIMVFSFILLWLSSKQVIKLAVQISQQAGVSTFLIGSIVSAIMTSIPEFMVALSAVVQGTPEMALGNVFGSNIANMTFLPAIPLLFIKKIDICAIMDKSLLLMLGAASLGMLLVLIPGAPHRLLAGLFIGVYVFILHTIINKDVPAASCTEPARPQASESFSFIILSVRLMLAFIGTALAGNLIVFSGKMLSQLLNFQMYAVGASVLSIGTNLPDIFLNIAAAKTNQSNLVLGSSIGSVLGQTFLTLSILMAFSNKFNASAVIYCAPWIFLISSFLLYCIYKEKGISRSAGMLLSVLFLGFFVQTLKLGLLN